MKNHKLIKLVRYLSTFCFVTLGSSTSACALFSADSTSDNSYRVTPVSENSNGVINSVDSYQGKQLLECVNEMPALQRFDIRSGFLTSKIASGWRYGWADNHAFRVIASAKNSLQQAIKYTKQTNQYRAQIKSWKNSAVIPKWSGLHAITRYQTADNMYLASIRYDGNVTIKVKYQGSYATLAQTKLTNDIKNYLDEEGHLATDQWYKINFSAVGEKLTLSLDGVELLAVNNQLLTQGTIGIRTDHVEAYLDDWLLVESEKAIEGTALDVANEVLLREVKMDQEHCLAHHGHCLQANNNQGIWETASDNSLQWDGVEYQANPVFHATEVAKLEPPTHSMQQLDSTRLS